VDTSSNLGTTELWIRQLQGCPCIRGVESFTAGGQKDYLCQCFIFLDGKLTRLPTQPWAEIALCTPGQA